MITPCSSRRVNVYSIILFYDVESIDNYYDEHGDIIRIGKNKARWHERTDHNRISWQRISKKNHSSLIVILFQSSECDLDVSEDGVSARYIYIYKYALNIL